MQFSIRPTLIWRDLQSTDIPIIIYGAGGQGQRLFEILKKNCITPSCFCVTDKCEENELLGLKLYSYSELKYKYSKYILLIATLPLTALEIENFLVSQNEKNVFYNMCVPFKMEDTFLDINDINIDYERYKKYLTCFRIIYQENSS